MYCRLTVLGVHVELSGPERLVRPIALAYGHFRSSGSPPADVSLATDDPPSTFEIDGQPRRFAEGLDPLFQFHQQFLKAVLDRVDRLAVLHSAALVGPGGALLLAGPSGHGKSSITLELVCRGYRFLSDDYAPVDLDKRLVYPFPRRVALSATLEGPVPDRFAKALADDRTPTWFDKRLVDVGDVLGAEALAEGPAPLKQVVLLRAAKGASLESRSRFDVAVQREEAERLVAEFAGIDGVRVRRHETEAGPRHLELLLDHGRRASRSVEPLLEDAAVVYHRKYWDSRPDFSEEPSLERVGTREAAGWLGRELLNRGAASTLTARLPGAEAQLYVELAGALAEAQCYALVPGPLGATADTIERLCTDTDVDFG